MAPHFGAAYVNQGRQEVELRWASAVRIHTHVETDKVEHALAELVPQRRDRGGRSADRKLRSRADPNGRLVREGVATASFDRHQQPLHC